MDKNPIIILLALSLVVVTSAPVGLASHSSTTATYVGAATVVVSGGGTSGEGADEGTVRCSRSTGDGEGGFCLHDNNVETVFVQDDGFGPDFAFQVCRDSDLDGFCTDAETYFSHGNNGAFVNPVDVPGNPGAGQVVVFVCAGFHNGDHIHFASTGVGTGVADPHPGVLDGFTAANGFCGGSTVGKPYVFTDP